MLGCLIFTSVILFVLEVKNPYYDPGCEHWKTEASVKPRPVTSLKQGIGTCQTWSDHIGVIHGLLQYKSSFYHNCRNTECGLQTFAGSLSALFCLTLNEGNED